MASLDGSRFNQTEFVYERVHGAGEGQGFVACCVSHELFDRTNQNDILNWKILMYGQISSRISFFIFLLRF